MSHMIGRLSFRHRACIVKPHVLPNAAGSRWILQGGVALLISLFPATLLGQASNVTDARVLLCSGSPFPSCNGPASDSTQNSTAISQNGLGDADPHGSNTDSGDDWVHAWLREADQARASQPHFVSPIVTTHVLLVRQ